MPIKEVRKEIRENLSHIPDFFDLTQTRHVEAWRDIQDAQEIVIRLVSGEIFSSLKIEHIIHQFDSHVDRTCYHIDEDIHLYIYIYFKAVIDYILLVLLEAEEYEAAVNIRNFNDIYFENINPQIEDQK